MGDTEDHHGKHAGIGEDNLILIRCRGVAVIGGLHVLGHVGSYLWQGLHKGAADLRGLIGHGLHLVFFRIFILAHEAEADLLVQFFLNPH